MQTHTIYHVCEMKTGRKVYVGQSVRKAAESLTVGTCYGWGDTKMDAWLDADRRRRTLCRWNTP